MYDFHHQTCLVIGVSERDAMAAYKVVYLQQNKKGESQG
jgi:hypothetical protein